MDNPEPGLTPENIHVFQEKKGSNRLKDSISEYWVLLKRFGKECRRVIKVVQKPNKQEFITTAKVSGLGLAAIGMIGFILSIIQQLIL